MIAGTDLAGKTAIVTGGYSGLGLETVRALADAGVRVIVPARRVDAAQQALDGIAEAEVRGADLSDLDSVAAFTESVRRDGQPIDLVLNVAGIMATPFGHTAQGFESQFGTNHLGHFALVGGVADLLSDHARVISYSSGGHFRSPVRFDDIDFATTPYDPWVAYGQSKTANALFAVGLARRGAERGILAFSVHPGGIMTELQRHVPREELLSRGWIDEDGTPNPRFKTPAEGASTGLWAATATELIERSGAYCEDCSIKGIVAPDHSDMTTGGVKEWAIDPEAAERLWALSVSATGVDAFA
ncbi:NAD(P)-dependent dehydrogenase (short-subunit alcohol dehydrogenase family) [Microbacterium foliorum]|uniref:NAD(P)-dependent dehydrogenase (Short-subunit alcohol dehydrogenase family) n=1 Tax=Microbacterium foliorum TaxID=104336 RepID=A0ABU1HRH9_9MICO|nr:oxidoreductase [Microbacterium foliorum]MDR6142651.1 NAD(P)-dependent dehydrogenase (short-subunit alcohol dehydrogenase family) [Microbacterium foliorum]